MKYAYLVSTLLRDLQDFPINLAHTFKVLHKNKALLARYKNHCNIFARKNCKIILLQDLIKMLQENYLANNFILQESCNNFISLQEKLHFVLQDLQDMSNV